MTQDEIIRMATEVWGYSDWKGAPLERLERFADLVAAHEREACAKVCESMYNSPTFSDEYIECADAIRARGEK